MEKELFLRILFRIAKKYNFTRIIKLHQTELNENILNDTHFSRLVPRLKKYLYQIKQLENHDAFYNEIEKVLNIFVKRKVFTYLIQNDILSKCLKYDRHKAQNYTELAKTINCYCCAEFIMDGFAWHSTEEGSRFWANHYDTLHNLFRVN